MKKSLRRTISILAATVFTLLFVLSAGTVSNAEGNDASAVLDEGSTNEAALEAGSYKAGDIIRFGHYEQDGNTANGKEEIEWLVLKAESERVLVVSRYALDCRKYNERYTDVTWETCALRKWLNENFKNAAFTSAEQAKIPTVNLVNKNNPRYDVPGGNNTNDQIFLLSLEEAETYFGSYNWYDSNYQYGFNQNLITDATQYAVNNGARIFKIEESTYMTSLKDKGYTQDVIGRRGSFWWLRTPGASSHDVCTVDGAGSAGALVYNFLDGDSLTVRPALYISVTSPKSVSLNETSLTMSYGASCTLTATVSPKDADSTVTWTSSKPDVATVNNGVVKAKSAGQTIITVKTVNDLTASCTVTVFADDNPSNIFADIKYNTWQYEAAKAANEKGFMNGIGKVEGKILFSPDTDINRSQFVTALYGMEGKPEVDYVQRFSDVKSDAWYALPVTWASNNGIVKGNPDGTFGKNGKATREQLALMLYQYAKYKNYDVSVKETTTLDGFTDAAKVDSWAVTAIRWAVERKIISGKGNATTGYRIDPSKGSTRIECAAMMNKFDEVYSDILKFDDEELEEPIALPDEPAEENVLIPEEEPGIIVDEDDAQPDEDVEDGDFEDKNIED